MGVRGGKEIGGRISQFKVAPQVIAAKERIAVGRVKEWEELLGLRRGGC